MIEELVSRCFQTRNRAHLEHWVTKSYATHQALGSFYDDLIDKVDSIVEAYQGSTTLIVPPKIPEHGIAESIIKVLTDDANWISKNRSKIAKNVPAIENLLDDLVDLYLSTIYKLKYLS